MMSITEHQLQALADKRSAQQDEVIHRLQAEIDRMTAANDADLQRAIRELTYEYEKAKQLEHVNCAIAYALYHVWRMEDSRAKKTLRKVLEEGKEE